MANSLASFFILFSSFGLSQQSYEMTKLGRVQFDFDLDSLYRQCLGTMVIINDIAYTPSSKCIDKRHYGFYVLDKTASVAVSEKTDESGVAEKNIGGGMNTKNKSEASAQKSDDSGNAQRKKEDASDTKNKSNLNSSRHSESDFAERSETNSKTNRTNSNDQAIKSFGSGDASRTSGSGSADRESGSGEAERHSNSGAMERHYDAYKIYIKCRTCEGGFEIVDLMGKTENIWIYDGVRKTKVIDKKILIQ